MTSDCWTVLPLLTPEELRSVHEGALENLQRIKAALDLACRDVAKIQREIQRRETADLEVTI